uniref:Uncharacterized protein n=1 Tax=Cacopsylla melanoneura TaxID=428564 RepID=A0A8D8VJZ9_9HEMI
MQCSSFSLQGLLNVLIQGCYLDPTNHSIHMLDNNRSAQFRNEVLILFDVNNGGGIHQSGQLIRGELVDVEIGNVDLDIIHVKRTLQGIDYNVFVLDLSSYYP